MTQQTCHAFLSRLLFLLLFLHSLCLLSRNLEKLVSHSERSETISPRTRVLTSPLKISGERELTDSSEMFSAHRMSGQYSGARELWIPPNSIWAEKNRLRQFPLTSTEKHPGCVCRVPSSVASGRARLSQPARKRARHWGVQVSPPNAPGCQKLS